MRVHVEIEPEADCVRGNALASGDDAKDKQAEDEILARLERGDQWAWCSVRVVVESDCGMVRAESNWLGCCSYQDEAEYRADRYFRDQLAECHDALFKLSSEVARLWPGART